MVVRVRRPWLYAVTVLFLISLIAPTVRLTSAQGETTPTTVEEVAPAPTEAPPPPEPTAISTDSPVIPTEQPAVEGPTLEQAAPTTEPLPTEAATVSPDPTAAPTSEQAAPPTQSPDAVVDESTEPQAQQRIAPSAVDPTLTFAVTTNDGGNPDGIVVDIIEIGVGTVASATVDSTGSASATLPFGTYTYSVFDPHGIYSAPLGQIDFTTDGQLLTIPIESTLQNGSVTFLVTTSDGGSAQGAYVNVYSEDTGAWYPTRWLGEDNTVTVPRLPYGVYSYSFPDLGIYQGASAPFAVGQPSTTINVTLQARANGTITLDGSTSDGGGAQGAYVELLDAQGYWVAGGYLDENHDVTFPQILFGTYTFSVSPYDIYEGLTGTIDLAADSASATFTLQAKPLSTLTVNVTTSDSGSAEGASIELLDRNGYSAGWGTIGANNQATMERLAQGEYTWTIPQWDVYGEATGTINLDSAEITLDVTLQAQPIGTVTFDGSTDDGQQPEGAYLALRTADGGYVRDVQLDGNLDAVLERIPYGSYTYYAGDSYNVYPQVSGSFTLDGPELTVSFELISVASGIITLDGTTSDGGSADGIWFWIETIDLTWGQGGSLDSSGDAALPRFPNGEYRLTVTDSYGRYESLVTTFTLDRGAMTVSFDLVAFPSGTLTVTVLEAGTENPVAGASIVIRDSETGTEVATGVTGDDGTFATADQLAAGYYIVDVDHIDFISTSDGVHVSGDTGTTISLEPRVPGTLTIEVLEQGAEPGVTISGASVVVRENDSWEIVATGTTGDDGAFTTASLQGGDYYVEVTQNAYYSNSTWVRVNGDTSTSVWLDPRVAGILTISVIQSGAAPALPVEGAVVTVSYLDGASSQTIVAATGTTGADGTFITSTLEGRDYDVQAVADDYYDSGIGVRVNGDTATTVALEPRIPGTLTVEVLDTDTQDPIEGASVIVRNASDGNEVAAGTTDPNGMFTTGTLASDEYLVDVSKEGYYASTTWWVNLNGDTSTTVYLEPQIPGTLTVAVVEQGSDSAVPVANVSVVVRDTETQSVVATGTTGADGTFTTSSLPGDTYAVYLTKDGYYVNPDNWIRVSGDTTLTLPLEPRIAGTLTVTVLEQETDPAIPIAGATVTVRYWDETTYQYVIVATGTTDSEGVFTSTTIDGSGYDVEVTREGYFANTTWVHLSGDTSTTVYLQPRISGTLTVTVLESGSTVTIPEAAVTIRSHDTWEIVATGTTDVDGEFVTSEALTGGYYDVLVEKDNYYSGSIGTLVNGETSIGIELTPRIPGSITVTVLDESTGDPIPNADVWATSWDAQAGVIGMTDADGTFTTSVLTGGQYDIFASADGYYSQSGYASVSGDTSVTISLPPRIDGTLTVHITDRVTGNPVEGATVSLQSFDTWLIDPVGTTGPDGTFSAPLVAGSYYIVVTANGYFGIDEWSVFIDGDTTQDIALSPRVAGNLTVLATDANTGGPIPGASVTIISVDQPWQIIGTTDDDGSFTTFDVVEGGYYRIIVEADGFFAYQGEKAGYYVVEGDTEFSIRMYPALPGDLTFVVYDWADGAPLENASITMTSADGSVIVSGATGADGTFITSDATPGLLYNLSITADGYYAREQDRFYADGSDREIIFGMQPKMTGEVVLTVLRTITFEPIENATVTVWSGDDPYGDPLLTGSTDANGVFRSGELPADQVWYQVEADGYIATGLWSYRLWESVREDTIFLAPAGDVRTGTIVVQDALTGDPIEGAEVVVTCGKCDGVYRPYQGQTDAPGQYAIVDVAAARYMVTVSAQGYEDTYASIFSLELNLIEGDASLVVNLLPLSYIPDAQVTLAIQPGVDGSYVLVSSLGERFEESIVDGLADVGTVPYGRGYILTIAGNGYEPVTRNIDVQEDDVLVQTTLTTLATPTAEPSVTPSPSMTPEQTVTPSPSPSTTPVTPDPSPSVTPSPSPSVTPSTTPVETTTPVASETPVTPSPSPSVTPSETPVTPSPSPSITPSVTPEQTVTPDSTVTPDPSPSVTPESTMLPLETSLTLCSNPECTPPYTTGADGFTASWTVTEQTGTGALVQQAEIASIGGGSRGSVSLSALQQDAPQSWIITAVIKDGVATGFSEPLPLGGYRVCLNPVLTGPDGSTIVLPDVPPCDAVQLTEEGVVLDGGDTSEGDPVPFSAVIIGAPEIIPPAQEPPGQDDEGPSETATPPTSGETPAGGDQAPGSDSRTSGTTAAPVSGLPNTGSGGGQSPLAAWLLAIGATAMAATALGIRRRNRT